MRYDSFRHHRRSIRLQGYDYSWEGAYFVTICASKRACLLESDPIKQIVQKTWDLLPVRFPNVQLDKFVIMPNHIHGIIWTVGAGFSRPEMGIHGSIGMSNRDARTAPLRRMTLGQVVAYFKHQSTKAINVFWGDPNPAIPVWRRNYYDRIIRNEGELNRIRQYILDNPENWEHDPENVQNDRSDSKGD